MGNGHSISLAVIKPRNQRTTRHTFSLALGDAKQSPIVATALPPDVRRWLCPAVS
jgi:hypothetical protein